jgi:hypothetical protein
MDAGACGDLLRACRDAIAPAAPSGTTWVQKIVPFAQAFGPVLAIAGVVGGWIVISRDNNKRETRKEIRAQINDIAKLIRNIEDSARSYFQLAPATSEAARLSLAIRRDLQHLAGQLTALKPRHEALNFDLLLLAYRRSITGGEFDSQARVARSHRDILFLEIGNNAHCLIVALEEAFAKNFCKP